MALLATPFRMGFGRGVPSEFSSSSGAAKSSPRRANTRVDGVTTNPPPSASRRGRVSLVSRSRSVNRGSYPCLPTVKRRKRSLMIEGQPCEVSPASWSMVVSITGVPPVAATSRNPVAPGPAKTIKPSARQAAPAGVPGTAQMVIGVAPSL